MVFGGFSEFLNKQKWIIKIIGLIDCFFYVNVKASAMKIKQDG